MSPGEAKHRVVAQRGFNLCEKVDKTLQVVSSSMFSVLHCRVETSLHIIPNEKILTIVQRLKSDFKITKCFLVMFSYFSPGYGSSGRYASTETDYSGGRQCQNWNTMILEGLLTPFCAFVNRPKHGFWWYLGAKNWGLKTTWSQNCKALSNAM